MSLPPTRYFYQVKYARGYPFVPVKLAGCIQARPCSKNPEGCAVNPTSDGRYGLYGAVRRVLRRRVAESVGTRRCVVLTPGPLGWQTIFSTFFKIRSGDFR